MATQSLHGLRLLVVEDEYLLADEVVHAIVELGGEAIGPIPSLDAALQLAEREALDGAVLDVNVRGKMVFPLADLLVERAVPVLFTTGYDADGALGRYAHAPRVRKPYDLSVLERLLVETFSPKPVSLDDESSAARPWPDEAKPAPRAPSRSAHRSEESDAGGATIEALRAELARAREEVRARDDFAATVAHELRNPMTPIVAQVQRLLAQARRPDATAASLMRGLEFLDRAVDYYVRRATTLLEISRINTGRMSLEPTAVDLSALTQDAVRRYAFLAERAGTTIEARDVQSGVVGFCDRMSVEQVLDNLLSNAVKYGYEKPIEVALTADGAQATLRVRDHGAGISADDQARIFERFEQAAGQRGQGGFGIGLWLARQLVEAMDGAIDVESRLDQGSTFTVRLPLWTPRRTQQQQDQP